jgi:NADH-quinone oxidoreductase subunit A
MSFGAGCGRHFVAGRRPAGLNVGCSQREKRVNPFADLSGILLASATGGSVAEYVPVLVMLLFALGFAVLNLVASYVLGKKGVSNPVKEAAYECGMPPITDAHQRFSVKFYLVAILFVLFDIEVVFLYPWAVYFKAFPAFLFLEMLIFIGILFLGWWYVIRKGAVNWAQE